MNPFDMTPHEYFATLVDPSGAIDTLVTIPQVDRILTSGGTRTIDERIERLRVLSQHAPGRLIIVAGGGIDEQALARFAAARCAAEVHVGRAAREGNDPEAPVSAERVKVLKHLLGEEAAPRTRYPASLTATVHDEGSATAERPHRT